MTIPATALPWNGNPDTKTRPVIRWVDRNMRKIRGRAVKFQRYSPYDLEDFMQQAYVTALMAAEISENEGIPFEACFWILYTADCRSMGSNPVTRDCYQEYVEDYTEQGYAPTSTRALVQATAGATGIAKEEVEMIEGLIDMALQVMSERQRQVWRYLLGDRSCTTQEIAEILKVTRQVVERLRDSGLRRVRRCFRAAHASRDFQDRRHWHSNSSRRIWKGGIVWLNISECTSEP